MSDDLGLCKQQFSLHALRLTYVVILHGDNILKTQTGVWLWVTKVGKNIHAKKIFPLLCPQFSAFLERPFCCHKQVSCYLNFTVPFLPGSGEKMICTFPSTYLPSSFIISLVFCSSLTMVQKQNGLQLRSCFLAS